MSAHVHITFLSQNKQMNNNPKMAGEIALMMEAARTSETLVNVYQTTRRYNPEHSHLRTLPP
jgi:hypothetical protein